MNWRRLGALLLLFGAAAAFGRDVSFRERTAAHDSLRNVEPWQRIKWLEARGLSRDYYVQHSWRPTTENGLRCAGRWSYGPSVKVSLRATADDTIICLARGSGASLIRFRSQDSLTLQLLSDINCNGIVSRAIIQDTFVFCGMQQGGTGIEAWSVSNLTSPRRLSYVYLPSVMDIAVKDTFLYSIGYQQDSLRIFNIVNPDNPVQVGACADSGINGMCVAGNYCYLADQYGLYIDDVSNPANPHRVAAIGGFEALAVAVRDTLCFVGTYTSDFALRVYNVKGPATPFPVGSLAGIEAHDLCLPPTCDTVLYTPKLHVVNIADARNPRQIGSVNCPGWDHGVAAVPALNYALVADYFEGLVAVDITNSVLPHIDTSLFAAEMAQDIAVDNGRAYTASYHAGLQILDVSAPDAPRFLGSYDTVGTRPSMEAVCARDSFAYVPFYSRAMFRSVCVTDPLRPTLAGVESAAVDAKDMVLRDTLVYKVSMRNLQVVNVARPRQPVLVGTCMLPDMSYGVFLQDTLAFVTNAPTQVVNVADPAHPTVVAQIDRYAWNVFVKDTLAFFAGGSGLFTYSVANINSPYLIDSTAWDANVFDVVVVDTLAYVGCRDGVRLLSVANPAEPRLLAFSPTPYDAWRLTYVAPYVYAACSEAGICILETLPVGIAEPAWPGAPSSLSNTCPKPTLVRGFAWVHQRRGDAAVPAVYDHAGREQVVLHGCEMRAGKWTRLDMRSLPAGVYFVRFPSDAATEVVKIVKF